MDKDRSCRFVIIIIVVRDNVVFVAAAVDCEISLFSLLLRWTYFLVICILITLPLNKIYLLTLKFDNVVFCLI